ncbi:unnamed protein product, partial [Rotaria magnacalcarata]
MQGKNQMHQRVGNLRQAQSLDNIPRSFDSFYCDVNEKYHSDSRRRQSRHDEMRAAAADGFLKSFTESRSLDDRNIRCDSQFK